MIWSMKRSCAAVRVPEGLLRRLVLPQHLEGPALAVPGGGEAGIDLQGPVEAVEGLGVPAEPVEGRPLPVPGLGELGIYLEGLIVAAEGIVEPEEHLEGVSPMAPDLR